MFMSYTMVYVCVRIVCIIRTSIGTRSAFLSMKAAELKCQKVCQVKHFKTFRKAIGQELGLYRQKISATDRGEGERETVSIRRIIYRCVFLRFFSMKAAELKCQNFTVKKVCQVEHVKTFRI